MCGAKVIDLQAHKMQYHWFNKCPNCHDKFLTAYEQEIHICSQSKQIKRKTCEICKNIFITRHDLVRHVNLMHPGYFLHKCKLCSYQTNAHQSIAAHNKRLHRNLMFTDD